ncbi:hypothetical protein Ancab_038207 [Ancistrocladus abbreviatus]
MASATLAFSSLLCKFPQKQNQFALSLCKPNCASSLPPPSSLSPRPLFASPPKFSETMAPIIDSDAPVLESEPKSSVPEVSQLSETTATPAPKREEICAVVVVGSRQYIVFPGRWIFTQRLKGANVNDKIILNKVLLVGTKTSTYIGKPVVTNAAVHAVVEEQLLDKKVIVFKYKKKKNYRRNIGHRQPITRIGITGITVYEDFPAVTFDS